MKHTFFNRELSLLEFNDRVVDQAFDADIPLLERIRFLTISARNIEEFIMIRVARLEQMRTQSWKDPTNLTPAQQLERIDLRMHKLMRRQCDCLFNILIPALRKKGIAIHLPETLEPEERHKLHQIMRTQILPVLTPIRIAHEEQIPFTGNKRCTIFLLSDPNRDKKDTHDKEDSLLIIPIPDNISQFLWLSTKDKGVIVVPLESALLEWGAELCNISQTYESALFRMIKNGDLEVQEEEGEGFVKAMSSLTIDRQYSEVVRGIITPCSATLMSLLQRLLKIKKKKMIVLPHPLDLEKFHEIASQEDFSHLRWPSYTPVWAPKFPPENFTWDRLREHDILLHHPYDSSDPLMLLLQMAADDPAVLSIKMTLYRTDTDSPIVNLLIRAAQRGAQVTVVVELTARFDEDHNIESAKALERAGAIVIYGIVKIKVHAKVLLIVRREEHGLQRYFHLSTGNYNISTMQQYTDIGLMSTNNILGYELGLVFNAITGNSHLPMLTKLTMAPNGLKQRILRQINREMQLARNGEQSIIMAKMNTLCDTNIINALYKASNCGTKIFLNVRGACTLIPDVKGLSENIQVVSIIGRFLEHARIFYYYNGGNEEIYCGSTDWMPRNMSGRIELLFPIEQSNLRRQLKELLEATFNKNTRKYTLKNNGSYIQNKKAPHTYDLQSLYLNQRLQKDKKYNSERNAKIKVRRNQCG